MLASADCRQYINTDWSGKIEEDRGQLTGFNHSLSLCWRPRGNVGQSPSSLKLKTGTVGQRNQNHIKTKRFCTNCEILLKTEFVLYTMDLILDQLSRHHVAWQTEAKLKSKNHHEITFLNDATPKIEITESQVILTPPTSQMLVNHSRGWDVCLPHYIFYQTTMICSSYWFLKSYLEYKQ